MKAVLLRIFTWKDSTRRQPSSYASCDLLNSAEHFATFDVISSRALNSGMKCELNSSSKLELVRCTCTCLVRASSRRCPQQVVRVGPVEFGERHDTRTNGQHCTAADRRPTNQISAWQAERARHADNFARILARKLLPWNLSYRARQ